MEREDTAIILERMFPENPEHLTLDGLLSILGVYYWWNDAWLTVEDYIENVVDDASPNQFESIMNVLHDLPTCFCSSAGAECARSAQDCFSDYLKVCEIDDDEIEDPEDLTDELLIWAHYNQDDDDEKGPIGRAYEKFLVDRLAINGATDLEIGNALEVLELEEERRQLTRSDYLFKPYETFRDNGGTFEEFTTTIMVDLLLEDATFDSIRKEYEDIPHNQQLSVEDKRQLIVRFINEHSDAYSLLEVTYQKYKYGELPPYLYRFSE